MDNSKPEPLFAAPVAGKICPVCGKRSYSAGGVHPQCAVRQADAPRQKLIADQKRLERERAEQAAAQPK